MEGAGGGKHTPPPAPPPPRHSQPPASAEHAGNNLSSLESRGASAQVSPRHARHAHLPRHNGAAAFYAAAAALAGAGAANDGDGGAAVPAQGWAAGGAAEDDVINIDNLDKDGDDAFAVFVKESDLSEFLDLFNNDYTTYELGGGAGAEEEQIKEIDSLLINYEDDLAFLAGLYLPSAINAVRGSGAKSAASSSSALSISDSVSGLEERLYEERVTPHITQIINQVDTLIKNKNPVEKTEIKKRIKTTALERLLKSANAVKFSEGSSKIVAATSAARADNANARLTAAVEKRKQTIANKIQKAAEAAQAEAAQAAQAAKGVGAVSGISSVSVETFGQRILGIFRGQRVEGTTPNDQVKFIHGEGALLNNNYNCEICGRPIVQREDDWSYDHTMPVNYEAFAIRIFLGYHFKDDKNVQQNIKYYVNEIIELMQFLGGPAHRNCNQSKGQKKGLTCPTFNEGLGFSELTYNYNTLMDITFGRLNDSAILQDVISASLPVFAGAGAGAIGASINGILARFDNDNLKKIVYYIAQRLSFSVAKLRPVRYFMRNNIGFTEVNNRLKEIRREQSKIIATIAADTAAVAAANTGTVASAAIVLASPRATHNQDLSKKVALNKLRGTNLLPYNGGWERGRQLEFQTKGQRREELPEIPFFTPSGSANRVLDPLMWNGKVDINVDALKIEILANKKSILTAAKEIFDLLGSEPDDLGAAATEAIRFVIDYLPPSSKKAKPAKPAGAAERQHKTRFRKRNTRKRKTRKARK